MGVYKNQAVDRKDARKGKGQASRGGASDSEFINLELDKEQTHAFRQWRDDVEGVLAELDSAISDGYRVNVKFDDYSSSPTAFMFPDPTGGNAGYILTGRGGTAYRAIAEVIYKHTAVLGGDWSSWHNRTSEQDDPDF